MRLLKLWVLSMAAATGCLCTMNGQSGYSVAVTVNGGPETKIRLAYHLGSEQYIKDSTFTDGSGKCRFYGKEKLARGVYMIVFPGNTFFEFLAGNDQTFEISCDKSDPAGTLAFKGSDENTRFLDYQRKWKGLQEEAMAISDQLQKSDPASAGTTELRNKMLEQENRMKRYLDEVSEQNSGTLLGAIVKSLIPVDVKIPDVPIGIDKRDSLVRLYSYLSYKQHFFDHVDFTESGLVRSPVLASKLDQYFRQVVVQMPDSIIKEADIVIEKSEANREVYQYVAVWLFNKYATSEIMGHDAVVVHLADKVYLSGKAPWVTEEFKKDLAERIAKLRPNLLGNQASDLVMDSYAGRYVSLYDVKAEFTILYFWEPDCGHCKEATPMLKNYYVENRKSGIEVFAVCTQSDRQKWENYIAENKLTWINGWDPQRLTRFDIYYNVESTPLIYILDKNKRIIAKRLPVESVGPFIENYRKHPLY